MSAQEIEIAVMSLLRAELNRDDLACLERADFFIKTILQDATEGGKHE